MQCSTNASELSVVSDSEADKPWQISINSAPRPPDTFRAAAGSAAAKVNTSAAATSGGTAPFFQVI